MGASNLPEDLAKRSREAPEGIPSGTPRRPAGFWVSLKALSLLPESQSGLKRNPKGPGGLPRGPQMAFDSDFTASK